MKLGIFIFIALTFKCTAQNDTICIDTTCSSDGVYCFCEMKDADGLKGNSATNEFGFISNLNIAGQITRTRSNQTGAIWYEKQLLNINQCFDLPINFVIPFKGESMAEGMALVFAEQKAIGPGGPNLGIPAGKSLAIVIDTRVNNNDCNAQFLDRTKVHVSIIVNANFSNPFYGPVPIEESRFKLEQNRGRIFSMRLKYDAQVGRLQVLANNELIADVNLSFQSIFTNVNNVFTGITGASGTISPARPQLATIANNRLLYNEPCHFPAPFCKPIFIEDLRVWQPFGISQGIWEQENSQAIQRENGRPAFLWSPVPIIDARVKFSITTIGFPKNGFMGFALGSSQYNTSVNPGCAIVQNDLSTYKLKLIDWKSKGTSLQSSTYQLPAEDAYFISEIDATGLSPKTRRSEEIFWQHDQVKGTNPAWLSDAVFNVEIIFTASKLLIIVNNDTIFNKPNGNYSPTHLGFYCFEQQVTFYNFRFESYFESGIPSQEVICKQALNLPSANQLPRGVLNLDTLIYDYGDGFEEKITSKDFAKKISHRYIKDGDYSLRIIRKESTGCQLMDNVLIKVRGVAPNIYPAAKDFTLCSGETLLLTVLENPEDYTWADYASSPSILITKAGSYELRYKNQACNTIIDVKYWDPLDLNYQSTPVCERLDEGKIEFTISGGTAPYEVYLAGNKLSNSGIIEALPPGFYGFEIVDAHQCRVEKSIEVEEIKAPIYQIKKNDVSCYGAANGSIEIQNLSAGYTFYLNQQPSPLFREKLNPGVYDYTLVHTSGFCTYPGSIEIIQPQEVIQLKKEVDIELGMSVALNPSFEPSGQYIFGWSPNIDLNCSDCWSPFANPKQDQEYHVSIEDRQNGCVYRDTILVKVDDDPRGYIPDGFSPNGDGINDDWKLFAGKSPAVKQVLKLEIWEKQGGLVYAQYGAFLPDDPLLSWNGRFKNKDALQGTYVYVINLELVNGKAIALKGEFILLR